MTNDLIERLRARAYQSEKAARRHDKALATAPGSYASDFRQWSQEETESATLDRQAAAHIEALAERVRELEAALEEKRRDGFLTTWTIIRAAGGQVLVLDSVAADFAPDRAVLHREEDPESGGVIMRATLSAHQARKDKENG
jgi:hypothetical protein